MTILRLATRKSPMAMWQAHFVQQKIEARYPDITIELVPLSTKGDQDTSTPLADIGGKSLFVKELQWALLENRADFAVHCIKDMSVQAHSDLTLTAILERDDPRDAFVSLTAPSLEALTPGSCIGTSSPRRQAFLRALFPQLIHKNLRGNVNSRFEKLEKGEYAGIILAAAGLHRLGWQDKITQYLATDFFIPAIAQGALGLECRMDDIQTQQYLSFLDHAPTRFCITAERAVNQILGGDCYTPIAAFAHIQQDILHIEAMLTIQGKNHHLQHQGPYQQAQNLGEWLGLQLKAALHD